jgi:tetratricopeptide (TPR) repeat protein
MRRHNLFFLIVVVAYLAVPAAAQPDREKAVTHPLDCAYYLLTKDSLESTYSDSLTRTLFRVGRYDEGLAVSAVDDDLPSRWPGLISIGLDQAKAGDWEVARQIADSAFDNFLSEDNLSFPDVAALAQLLAVTSRRGKIQKLIERSEPGQRLALLRFVAGAYTAKGDRSSALWALDQVLVLPEEAIDNENDHYLIDIADLYSRNGQTSRAIQVLRRLWTAVREPDDERLNKPLYRRLYLYGLKPEALSVWKTVPDPDAIENRLFLSSVLIDNREHVRAETILKGVKKSELETYSYGRQVVKQWLRLSKPKVAENAADLMSDEADHYDQQNAYIQIADFYLASKSPASARTILDKAFAKARTIKFEHRAPDSIGASSGSRKNIYLREIRERWQKMGDLSKALETIRAIADPHPMAQEILVASLARFARNNSRKLPRKQVVDLLTEAVYITRADSDDVEVQIMADYAEALAKLRDRVGATDKLAELLEGRKGEYLEGYALLLSGEVFEKYKLPLTDRLRTALSAILDEHDT